MPGRGARVVPSPALWSDDAPTAPASAVLRRSAPRAAWDDLSASTSSVFTRRTAAHTSLFRHLQLRTLATLGAVLLSRASGARRWIKSTLGPSSVDSLGSA